MDLLNPDLKHYFSYNFKFIDTDPKLEGLGKVIEINGVEVYVLEGSSC